MAGQFVVPEVVASHFHLKSGDIVADYGAGGGFFLPVLSQAVGDTGRVYACEIQKGLVDRLTDIIRLKKLSNTQPMWCDLESPGGIKLPDETLDVAFVINTLFQFEMREVAMKEILRTVRRGGQVVIIDWTESFAGMGPHSDHVITMDMAVTLCETLGCVFVREFPAGDHHYGIAMRKV